ncbi:hypothetical protein V5799_003806 [Amblyomma americanum]|uniref:Peptidase M13 N-terminal domain-containing protein n=1 Tax=Amblyomma americanum TaxID=6943 RepID=A0AAQ4D7W9_AMBAM
MLAASIGAVVLFAVAVTGGIAAGRFLLRKPTAVCETQGCRRYSKALLESMDTSVDPCQDFGRYVCGRYSHPNGLSVAEAAKESYRDEVVAPAHNASLSSTGQNALEKGWRFYKSCEDVVEGGADNMAAVVAGLVEAGIGWPVPTAGKVSLVSAMVLLATKMGWPSLLDFVVPEASGNVIQVTINRSPYSTEILTRVKDIDTKALEAFFNLAARRIFESRKAAAKHEGAEVYRSEASFKDAVNFSSMMTLEKSYEAYFLAKPGTLVFHLPHQRRLTLCL